MRRIEKMFYNKPELSQGEVAEEVKPNERSRNYKGKSR
jgi:hypothetical protein